MNAAVAVPGGSDAVGQLLWVAGGLLLIGVVAMLLAGRRRRSRPPEETEIQGGRDRT